MNGHKIEDDDEVGKVMQLIFFSKMDLSFLFNTKLFDHNFRYVPHWISLITVEQKILRNWTINADFVQADTAMGEEDEFLMHQSSSGDLSDLLELPVKLERFDP